MILFQCSHLYWKTSHREWSYNFRICLCIVCVCALVLLLILCGQVDICRYFIFSLLYKCCAYFIIILLQYNWNQGQWCPSNDSTVQDYIFTYPGLTIDTLNLSEQKGWNTLQFTILEKDFLKSTLITKTMRPSIGKREQRK